VDGAAPVIRRVHSHQHARLGAQQALGLLDRITDQPLRAPGGVARTLAQPLSDDHRGGRVGGQRGQQRVEAADPGVAEPGSLLGVPVDLDDGVVDIEQCISRAGGAGTGRRTQQSGEPG